MRKKNTGKQILALLLATVLATSLCVPALATGTGSLSNFKPQKSYSNQYTDVKKGDFCYEGVKLCYEYGIMNGISTTKFGPNQNITYGQLLAIAARLHNIYMGGTGDFSKYPDRDLMGNAEAYFIEEGIEYYTTRRAVRCDLSLFGFVLGDEAFTPINHLTAVPDFTKIPSYYTGVDEQILKLYNAGILTGSDKYGTFYYNTPITRGAVAAIVARIVDPTQRKILNLETGKAPIVGVLNRANFFNCPNMMAFHDKNLDMFQDEAYSVYYEDRWGTYYETPNDVMMILRISSLGDNGYEVKGLDFGTDGKRQYELVYAFLKDVTENPDAIYAKLTERNDILTKGYSTTTGISKEAHTWQDSNEGKTTKIGNINFTWGDFCNSFIIAKASN